MKSSYLTLFLIVFGLGFVAPRFIGGDDIPKTAEAEDLKERIIQRYPDWEADEFEVFRRNFIMQRLRFSNYEYSPGSCAGDRTKPKRDKKYDMKIFATEIGPFFIPVNRITVVCDGKIPLRGARSGDTGLD